MKNLVQLLLVISIVNFILACKPYQSFTSECDSSLYNNIMKDLLDTALYRAIQMTYEQDEWMLVYDDTGHSKKYRIKHGKKYVNFLYTKYRLGLSDYLKIRSVVDTIYIIDSKSDESDAFTRSIYWTSKDTLITENGSQFKPLKFLQSENERVILSPKTKMRMSMISQWDTSAIRNIDSISTELKRKNKWVQYGYGTYQGTRIILKLDTFIIDTISFRNWAGYEKYKDLGIQYLTY